MKLPDLILIGEIKSVISTDGSLSIAVDPGFAEPFSELDFVFIEVFGEKRKFFIEDFNLSHKGPLLKFVNFDSEEDVLFLLKRRIYVPKSELRNTSEEEYIIRDLLGCEVFFKDKFFGKVTNIEKYPGNDVVSILKEDGNEVLLPFVDEFFGEVDIDNNRIELIKEIEFTDDEI